MSRISLDNINCWEDFKSYAEGMPNTKSMGDAFEHLTYLYFMISPKYSFYDEVYSEFGGDIGCLVYASYKTFRMSNNVVVAYEDETFV